MKQNPAEKEVMDDPKADQPRGPLNQDIVNQKFNSRLPPPLATVIESRGILQMLSLPLERECLGLGDLWALMEDAETLSRTTPVLLDLLLEVESPRVKIDLLAASSNLVNQITDPASPTLWGGGATQRDSPQTLVLVAPPEPG